MSFSRTYRNSRDMHQGDQKNLEVQAGSANEGEQSRESHTSRHEWWASLSLLKRLIDVMMFIKILI